MLPGLIDYDDNGIPILGGDDDHPPRIDESLSVAQLLMMFRDVKEYMRLRADMFLKLKECPAYMPERFYEQDRKFISNQYKMLGKLRCAILTRLTELDPDLIVF